MLALHSKTQEKKKEKNYHSCKQNEHRDCWPRFERVQVSVFELTDSPRHLTENGLSYSFFKMAPFKPRHIPWIFFLTEVGWIDPL